MNCKDAQSALGGIFSNKLLPEEEEQMLGHVSRCLDCVNKFAVILEALLKMPTDESCEDIKLRAHRIYDKVHKILISIH